MNLLGRWQKTTPDPSAAQYPDNIEFKPNGQYRGTKGVDGADFTLWDVGTYKIDGNKISISTANDAVIPYPASLQGSVLTFTDPAGVKIQYKQAP